MLINGDSWEGFVHGVVESQPNNNMWPSVSYNPLGGLAFFDGYVLDAHFGERGREGRLIKVLQETRNIEGTGVTRGIASDEETALVISDLYSRPVGTVIGTRGGVTIIDVTNVTSHPSNTTDYEHIQYSYLTLDDAIDLTTGISTVYPNLNNPGQLVPNIIPYYVHFFFLFLGDAGEITFASWKSSLVGVESYESAIPSDDIFSNNNQYRWSETARILMDNRNDDVVSSVSNRKDPEFEVVFDRSVAERVAGAVPWDPSIIKSAYKNMIVHIRPSGNQ